MITDSTILNCVLAIVEPSSRACSPRPLVSKDFFVIDETKVKSQSHRNLNRVVMFVSDNTQYIVV